MINGKFLSISYLHQRIECWRRLPLQNGFLCSAPPGFLITQGDGVNSAKQIRQGWIHQQIVERLPMRGRDQLHSPFGNSPGGQRFGFGSDLVDDDNLGHVIFHGFNHHCVLQVRPRHLHPAAGADAGMRNIAVAADFIRCIDDDDSFHEFGGKHTRALPQKRSFPHAGPAKQEQALSGLNHIAKNIHRAKDRPAHAARQSDDDVAPVPYRRYPVQRALDARTVILGEGADAVSYIVQVFAGDRRIRHIDRAVGKPGFRRPAEVQNGLDEIPEVGLVMQRVSNVGRHDAQK